MKTALVIFQIIISVILTALIFLQSNGDTESQSNLLSTVNFEKRGWEKFVFSLTIGILAVFLLSSLILTLV
ncbi:MAG TPA: preprotein translocase subunit SecG [Patescibacteria group bacterium]